MLGMTNPVNLSTYQLAQLHRYAGIGFLSSLANALIVVAFFWNQVEQSYLLAWFSSVLVVSIARFLYARKHQGDDRSNLASGSGTLWMITLANGLIWGVFALFIYSGVEEPYQIFLILMLSVASASALPWYIAAPYAYTLYLACVIAPLITLLLASGNTTGQLMTLMLLVFAGTLAITAHSMHQGLMESLYKHCGYQTLASTDNLTQLPNRGTFDDTLASTWKRATHAGLSLSVIMIDVDNFKKYNDFYGHQEGDRCLKEVANALGGSVRRAGDMVARYGGEEFVAVLPQMACNDSMEVAERMRAAVANLKIPHEKNGPGFVTISLGGATCIPDMQDDPAILVKSADEALYEAKQSGRNQVQWNSII